MEPLIDVLIPVYNAVRTVEGSLLSIQRQTCDRIRIIVVDDGSTDGSSDLLRELARHDPRIVVLHQANSGIVDGLNRAVEASSAPFLARHDADDIAYPHRLQRQLEYLNLNPDCIAVSANAWHIGENGAKLGTRTLFIGDVDPDPCAIPAREPYLMHPFLMLRRQALIQAGGYRHCHHAEDADLYWRLLKYGRLHNIDEILGEYRIHQGSISGGSAFNGKISAIYSQLAALSYRRTVAGESDITFPRGDPKSLRQNSDFLELYQDRLIDLSEGEIAVFRMAAAAKLLAITSYRAFNLSVKDCSLLSEMLVNIECVQHAQRATIRRTQAEVLRLYIQSRLWQQIRAFAFPLEVFARLPRRYLWKYRNDFRAWRAKGSLRG